MKNSFIKKIGIAVAAFAITFSTLAQADANYVPKDPKTDNLLTGGKTRFCWSSTGSKI